ncbi:unnamed protein product [Euphydryas editha]|uniref:Gag protein n=1 Tax=Euphydryas editha TaxID=104508 RepID=A0AAU9TSB3_EUPED|nr:unnamed protein product [Euphydryas editha]
MASNSNYMVNVPKLRGRENYNELCFAAENFLVLEGTLGFIKPELGQAPVGAVDDAKTRAKLILTINPSIYVHIKEVKSTKELWNKLKSLYDDFGFTRRIGLLRNLISIRLEDCDSMNSYVTQLVETEHKLAGSGFNIIYKCQSFDDFKQAIELPQNIVASTSSGIVVGSSKKSTQPNVNDFINNMKTSAECTKRAQSVESSPESSANEDEKRPRIGSQSPPPPRNGSSTINENAEGLPVIAHRQPPLSLVEGPGWNQPAAAAAPASPKRQSASQQQPQANGRSAPRSGYPPITAECLPNWTLHFDNIRQRLGHAPNACPLGKRVRFLPGSIEEFRRTKISFGGHKAG